MHVENGVRRVPLGQRAPGKPGLLTAMCRQADLLCANLNRQVRRQKRLHKQAARTVKPESMGAM